METFFKERQEKEVDCRKVRETSILSQGQKVSAIQLCSVVSKCGPGGIGSSGSSRRARNLHFHVKNYPIKK